MAVAAYLLIRFEGTIKELTKAVQAMNKGGTSDGN